MSGVVVSSFEGDRETGERGGGKGADRERGQEGERKKGRQTD